MSVELLDGKMVCTDCGRELTSEELDFWAECPCKSARRPRSATIGGGQITPAEEADKQYHGSLWFRGEGYS